jgi:hypothetical protein
VLGSKGNRSTGLAGVTGASASGGDSSASTSGTGRSAGKNQCNQPGKNQRKRKIPSNHSTPKRSLREYWKRGAFRFIALSCNLKIIQHLRNLQTFSEKCKYGHQIDMEFHPVPGIFVRTFATQKHTK